MGAIQHLYETGQITSAEMEKLSDLRAGLLEAMDDGYLATIEFIKEAFEGSTPEEIGQLDRIIDSVEVQIAHETIQKHGEDGWLGAHVLSEAAMLKLAAGGKTTMLSKGLEKIWEKLPGKKYLPAAATASILASLGLSLLGSARQGIGLVSQPITGLMERRRLRTQSTGVLTDVLKANPELKQDKKTLENFQMLQRYAPNTVATNKPVAEAMLKKMQQWGQVDPLSLQQMIKMEREHLQNLRDKPDIPEFHAPKMDSLAELIGAGEMGLKTETAGMALTES